MSIPTLQLLNHEDPETSEDEDEEQEQEQEQVEDGEQEQEQVEDEQEQEQVEDEDEEIEDDVSNNVDGSTSGSKGGNVHLEILGTVLNADDSVLSCTIDVFLCEPCQLVFRTQEECYRHLEDIHRLHGLSSTWIDDVDDDTEKETEVTVKEPKRPVIPPRTLGESIIPKKYRVSRELQNACSKCRAIFDRKEVLRFHEQCHLEGANTSILNRVPSLTSITSVPQLQRGFYCPVCVAKPGAQILPIPILRWGKLAWHLWKEHNIDCELYTCSICKEFKSYLITKVKEHELIHNPTIVFRCSTCQKTFKQSKQLRNHEKYHIEHNTKVPPIEDSRWYTPKECHICRRVLANSKCLKKHISAVHSKLRPYACNICGHTSARKAELQLHVRQHTGEKPYKCNQCPYVTGDHNSLRNHKLRHSENRPYKCSLCDYKCIQSCAFKRHMLRSHPENNAIFQCKHCPRIFVNEALSKDHSRDHEEGRIPEHGSDSNDGNGTLNRNRGESTRMETSMDSLREKQSALWLAEEDSIDLVDTGGITIPAQADESSNSKSNDVE